MKAVTTQQIRELDQRTIAAGTPGEELMERAGYAVARATIRFLKREDSRSVLLFAGKGNNGGDAIVAETEPSVVVDGLLGTGLKGEVREPYATAIKVINGLHLPVVAIDIPSGLGSDTGEVHGFGVRADMTVTMALPKIGLLKPAAADFVGGIEVADIGIPREFVEEIQTDVELLTAPDVKPLLPPRRRSANKGDFGHLLVIAGSEGYTGAPVMVAHAAARAGAGLVTLAVPRNIYPIVAAQCPPEVMPQPVETGRDTENGLEGGEQLSVADGG